MGCGSSTEQATPDVMPSHTLMSHSTTSDTARTRRNAKRAKKREMMQQNAQPEPKPHPPVGLRQPGWSELVAIIPPKDTARTRRIAKRAEERENMSHDHPYIGLVRPKYHHLCVTRQEFNALTAQKQQFLEDALQEQQHIQEVLTKFITSYLTHRILTGKQFNTLFSEHNYSIMKTIPETMISNGVKYQPGEIIDPVEYNVDKPCSEGGMYSAPGEQANRWLVYKKDILYIANVQFQDDAVIYIEPHDNYIKFKSSKLILGEFERWYNIPILLNTLDNDNGIAQTWVINNTCAIHNLRYGRVVSITAAKTCTCGHCNIIRHLPQMAGFFT